MADSNGTQYQIFYQSNYETEQAGPSSSVIYDRKSQPVLKTIQQSPYVVRSDPSQFDIKTDRQGRAYATPVLVGGNHQSRAAATDVAANIQMPQMAMGQHLKG